MNVFAFRIKAIFVTLLCQRFTKNQVCSHLSHWNIRYLRQEWHGTAGTWIHLDYINRFALDNELNIHHTNTVKTDSQTFSVISNRFLDFLRKGLWWVNCH